jgi:hypothetical protein
MGMGRAWGRVEDRKAWNLVECVEEGEKDFLAEGRNWASSSLEDRDI